MIIGLLTLLHIIVCLILIIAVLLQSGKGADLAGAFGGAGSQTAFGSRGPATFLTRMTTFAAVTFMITALALSIFYTRSASPLISLSAGMGYGNSPGLHRQVRACLQYENGSLPFRANCHFGASVLTAFIQKSQ